MTRAIPVLLLLLSAVANANNDVYQFASDDQKALYQALIVELRCLVCQNQNIADSNAELAQDLRRKTYELVTAGKTREEIADYMVQRYGNFVLYRPPLNPVTWLLWVGPFIILFLGVVVLMVVVRRQRRNRAEDISEADHSRARRLLDEGDST